MSQFNSPAGYGPRGLQQYTSPGNARPYGGEAAQSPWQEHAHGQQYPMQHQQYQPAGPRYGQHGPSPPTQRVPQPQQAPNFLFGGRLATPTAAATPNHSGQTPGSQPRMYRPRSAVQSSTPLARTSFLGGHDAVQRNTGAIDGPPISSLSDMTPSRRAGNRGSGANVSYSASGHRPISAGGYGGGGDLVSPVSARREHTSPRGRHTFQPASPYTPGGLAVDQTADANTSNCVTVFGFAAVDAAFMEGEFSQYGTIVRRKHESGGNWMHLEYESSSQASKALSKSGQRFGGKIMVGVQPCRDAEFLGRQAANAGGQTSFAVPSAPPTSSATPRRARELRLGSSVRENPVTPAPGTPQKSQIGLLREYLIGW